MSLVVLVLLRRHDSMFGRPTGRSKVHFARFTA